MKFSIKYYVALFLLFAFTHARAQTLPDSTIKKIDSLFNTWNKNTSPGCAIGIIRNDSLIYAKGYGMANLEYSIPITSETIFHMASVSKQFTAYSIVLLAHAGKLKLEDDIHKYLPWFPNLHEKITIRHLLNHTSGIRDQWQLLAIGGTRLDDVITQQQIVKVLSKQQALNFKPGDEYSYSNSGFTMLAEIVKSVTGQTLRQFTDSAIFKPLGMKDTHFHDDYTEVVKNRAYSYERVDSPALYANDILSYSNAGATSLFTNINDLSKWAMNFYKPVAGSKADIDQLVQKGKLNNGTEIDYALGISVDLYKGWKQYSHSGGDAGYRTYITVIPDLKMGFMVFSNLGDVRTGAKAEELSDLFVFDTAAKSTAAAEKVIDTTLAIIKDEARWKKFTGDYIAEDGAEFSFALRNHKLYWDRYGNSDLLYNQTKDTFIVVRAPTVKFLFSTAADKSILVNEYWPEDKRLLRKNTAETVQRKQLQTYAGTYYSPELDCNYTIIVKDNALLLTNSKYDDSKIKLVGADHLFTDYWWMEHLKIIRDNQRKIVGFEVNSGRIKHLRFNKI